jgi:hypothetical protein
MIGSHNDPGYRAISIVCLIQVGVVVFGTMFVTLSLKGAGYGRGDLPNHWFNSAAVLVRNWGLLLLLFPVLWVAAAMYIQRKFDLYWPRVTMIVLGITSAIWLIQMYLNLCFNPLII